jgi:hypothetical protein
MSDLLKEFDQAMLTRAGELGRAGGLSVVEPVSGIAETEIGKTRAETGRPKSAGLAPFRRGFLARDSHESAWCRPAS